MIAANSSGGRRLRLLIDTLTPYSLWKEISEDRNTALAIVVGAMSLGICTIIAAAIHG